VILISAALVLVAIILLIAGVVLAKPFLVIWSIVVSLLSAVCLLIGAFVRRHELFPSGAASPDGPSPGSSPAPDQGSAATVGMGASTQAPAMPGVPAGTAAPSGTTAPGAFAPPASAAAPGVATAPGVMASPGPIVTPAPMATPGPMAAPGAQATSGMVSSAMPHPHAGPAMASHAQAPPSAPGAGLRAPYPPSAPSSRSAEPGLLPPDTIVKVIPGRRRFHRPGCRQLAGRDSEELTYEEAREEGFTACTTCLPEGTARTTSETPFPEPDDHAAPAAGPMRPSASTVPGPSGSAASGTPPFGFPGPGSTPPAAPASAASTPPTTQPTPGAVRPAGPAAEPAGSPAARTEPPSTPPPSTPLPMRRPRASRATTPSPIDWFGTSSKDAASASGSTPAGGMSAPPQEPPRPRTEETDSARPGPVREPGRPEFGGPQGEPAARRPGEEAPDPFRGSAAPSGAPRTGDFAPVDPGADVFRPRRPMDPAGHQTSTPDAPPRERTPEPAWEPAPEPVRERGPEPVGAPAPQPVRDTAPEPTRDQAPEPADRREPGEDSGKAPAPERPAPNEAPKDAATDSADREAGN